MATNPDTTPELTDSAALAALNEAALIIAAEHSLDKVLQRIVDLARRLVGARYGALGVPEPDGRMGRFVISGMPHEVVIKIAERPTGRGILGLLLNEPQTLILQNVADHPAAIGFPAHHPAMSSFLGVSITARGKLLGNLYLTDKEGDEGFSQKDAELIKALSAHAAVAIENTQLYDQVRRLAVLEERERIGMDLHDGIIQSIYAVGLSLELSQMVLADNPDESRDHVSSAIQGLDRVIRDLRSYIMDLQPARIQDESLPVALDRLVREFRANTLVQVKIEFAPDSVEDLADSTRLALFHITQEALANIAKHAQASLVVATVDRLRDRMVLKITDDGMGFDSDKIGGIPGHGLSNMAMRARYLGGDLTVTSTPGQGTQVRAVIPAQPTSETPPVLVAFP